MIEQLDGFQMNSWLEEKLAELEHILPEEEVELTLHPDINPTYFVAKLGEPARDYEYGGLSCPQTGSTVITRSLALPDVAAFLKTEVKIPHRRWHADNTIDDYILHTHPWNPKTSISYFELAQNAARPSDGDLDILMGLKRLDLEDGLKVPITFYLGSGGYLSITHAADLNFEDETLASSGLNPAQIISVRRMLALSPPEWTKNFARPGKGVELEEAMATFYDRGRASDFKDFWNMDLPPPDEVTGLIEPALKRDFFIKIGRHLPTFPRRNHLYNLGFNQQQIDVVSGMTGITTEVYRLIDGVGLEKVA